MLWVRSSIASDFDRARSDFARGIVCEKSVAHVHWTDKKTPENQHNRRSTHSESGPSGGQVARVLGGLFKHGLGIQYRLNICRGQRCFMQPPVSFQYRVEDVPAI